MLCRLFTSHQCQHHVGALRVNAAPPVFNHLLAPLLPAFLARYPRIRVELVSGESIVDLIEERADVAIRVGALQDSTLSARLLCESRLRLRRRLLTCLVAAKPTR